MENLYNVNYDLMNYRLYQKRLDEIMKSSTAIDYSFNRFSLGKTAFGYDIDCIKAGNGDKHLFIVGGTHGSEIISVDFVTQLMGNLSNINNFDPNEFTIFFVPNQNPEGYIVTTDTLNEAHVGDDFTRNSKEYYYRYKMDNLIKAFLSDLEKWFEKYIPENTIFDIDKFLIEFKKFINTNPKLVNLDNGNMLEGISLFKEGINNIDKVTDFQEFKYRFAAICNMVNDKVNNPKLFIFLDFLKSLILSGNLISELKMEKYHQNMFKDTNFDIKDTKLKESIVDMYEKYNHPMGSQVTFDANGLGVNLNANKITNPGIKAMQEDNIIYSVNARNNVRKYVPGPIGTPTVDAFNFEYANENKALYKLIKKSYDEGKYCGTVLYHGTGGMIFSKVCDENMSIEDYNLHSKINEQISDQYIKSTEYKRVESTDYNGYGDLLREKFPGVIMVELSKMGGNPIAPYGDENNIYNTMNSNMKAVDDLLAFYKNDYDLMKKSK